MTSASSLVSSVGLATGIDTDNLIQSLMAVDNNQIVLLRQRISEIEADKDAYSDINTRLNSLKTKNNALVKGTVFDEVTASSSNTSVLTATATSSAAKATYDVRVKQLAKADSVISAKGATFTFGGASATIQVNGEDVTVYGTTLTDLRNAINGNDDAKATASIVDGRLIVTNDDTGVSNTLTLKDNDPNNGILEQLGILTSDAVDDSTIGNDYAGDNTKGGYKTRAQDAIFSVDGLEISRSKNQGVDDVITGVTLSLKGVSDYTGAAIFPDSYESTSLTITPNDTSVITAIQAFVDQYNSAVEFISTQTAYDSETEVAGELQGQFFANNIKSQLTNYLFSANSGTTKYHSLFDLVDSEGKSVFTMGSASEGEGGKLKINQDALKNVLETNRNDVRELFAYDGNGDKLREDGVAVRLEKYLTDLTKSSTGMIADQIESLENSVDSLNDSIDRKTLTLESREAALRKEFSAMEQMVSRLQSNASYFSSSSS